METISGDFKCPKCGVENAVASLSNSTHYSTWMAWKKRANRWIIGCVGYENEKPIWWWDVFRYVHQENGDEALKVKDSYIHDYLENVYFAKKEQFGFDKWYELFEDAGINFVNGGNEVEYYLCGFCTDICVVSNAMILLSIISPSSSKIICPTFWRLNFPVLSCLLFLFDSSSK